MEKGQYEAKSGDFLEEKKRFSRKGGRNSRPCRKN